MAHACWAMVHGLSSLMGLGILQIQNAAHAALTAYADQAIAAFLRGVESGEGRRIRGQVSLLNQGAVAESLVTTPVLVTQRCPSRYF